MNNKTKYITKKQLATLPCRFVLGCIGISKELDPKIDIDLLGAINHNFGTIY